MLPYDEISKETSNGPLRKNLNRTTLSGTLNDAQSAKDTPNQKWTNTVKKIQFAQQFTSRPEKLNNNQRLSNSQSVFDVSQIHLYPFQIENHRIYSHESLDHTARSVQDENFEAEDLSWKRLHMSKAKLKSSSTTSEILSGFALITMVELQINYPTNVPEWLFILFAINTTVVVSLNVFAIMISTYLLPQIEVTAKSEHRKSAALALSPHERMKKFIEVAWVLSNFLGLFLFLVQLAILCWVKFWDYSYNAALAAMVIIVPCLLVFIIFALHFYHAITAMKWKTSSMEVRELEDKFGSLV